MGRPKNSDATATRDKILDEALVLFAEAGYAGASIRKIARAVGLRESSIYTHFASKEDIYRSLISQWGAAAFIERLESDEYKPLMGQPEAFCRQCGADLVKRWLDERERLFIAMVNSEAKEFHDIRVQLHDMLFRKENQLLAKYFSSFSDAGLLRAVDVNELARIFSSGLICLRRVHVDAPDGPASKRTLQRAMNRYLDTFLQLVSD